MSDGDVRGADSDGDWRRLRRVDVFEDAGVEELTEGKATGGDGGPAVVVEIRGGGVEVEAETSSERSWREVGFGLGSTQGTSGAVVG